MIHALWTVILVQPDGTRFPVEPADWEGVQTIERVIADMQRRRAEEALAAGRPVPKMVETRVVRR